MKGDKVFPLQLSGSLEFKEKEFDGAFSGRKHCIIANLHLTLVGDI